MKNSKRATNLSKINEQLDVIGRRHERIESELTTIAQSVVNLQETQKDTNEKNATLENAVERNILDMADRQNNIKDLTETKQQMEQDMNSGKENLAGLVTQKAQEALQQQNGSIPQPPETSTEMQNETTQKNWILSQRVCWKQSNSTTGETVCYSSDCMRLKRKTRLRKLWRLLWQWASKFLTLMSLSVIGCKRQTESEVNLNQSLLNSSDEL